MTEADRQGLTALLSTARTVAVPVGTRAIHAVLTMTRTDGTFNDGYADSLGVKLRLRTSLNLVVTDPGDNGGPNQLRAKLAMLQAAGGGTLGFNLGFATIVLQQGFLPPIITNCVIGGADKITIRRPDTFRNYTAATNATRSLPHITLAHGYGIVDGGAVINAGTLNVESSMFLNNHTSSTRSGGAIFSTGRLNISQSEFGLNEAGNGGPLYLKIYSSSTAINNSTFHDNSTTDTVSGWGGAVLAFDGAVVSIQDSTFNDNSASLGGGFYLFANTGQTNVTLSRSTVTDNVADGGSGGAFYVTSNSTLNLSEDTLYANAVTAVPLPYNPDDPCPASGVEPTGNPANGGAIYNNGTTVLNASTLRQNRVTGGMGGFLHICGAGESSIPGHGGLSTGGALYNAGVTILSNSTLFANVARGGDGYSGVDGTRGQGMGGAICNLRGLLTMNSCTITQNAAESGFGGPAGQPNEAVGGGIMQATAGASNVRNNLIADNRALVRIYTTSENDVVSPSDVFGAFASTGYNFVKVTSGSTGFSQPTDIVGVDPKLDPAALEQNGGPTRTIALLPGSPVIDRGFSTGLTVDQRGLPRPSNDPQLPDAVGGDGSDIGAFELQAGAPQSLFEVKSCF